MKKVFLFFIVIIAISCKKDNENANNGELEKIQFDYIVIRESSLLRDSSIFYYNNENKLLAIDRYSSGELTRKNVEYESDRITIGDDVYYISNNYQIDSVIEPDMYNTKHFEY